MYRGVSDLLPLSTDRLSEGLLGDTPGDDLVIDRYLGRGCYFVPSHYVIVSIYSHYH